MHHAILEGPGTTHQNHALVGELAEIHGLAAMRPADRDGHMFHARLSGFGVQKPENPLLSAEIFSTTARGRSVMRADGQIDPLARAQRFTRDLCTR